MNVCLVLLSFLSATLGVSEAHEDPNGGVQVASDPFCAIYRGALSEVTGFCFGACHLEAEEFEGFTGAACGPLAEPEMIWNFQLMMGLTLFLHVFLFCLYDPFSSLRSCLGTLNFITRSYLRRKHL